MARAYEDGELFPYRGEPLALTMSADARGVSARDGRLIVPRGARDELRRRVLWWYTAETECVIRELVPAWAKRLGVRPRSATVRLVRTRWGSCAASGDLYFNSRIAMLTPDVAEYLVVHELCHLRRMDHSPAFWREVEAALPSARELRASLRAQESTAVL